MSEADTTRWLYLYERSEAGTITPSESIEFRQYSEALDKKSFESCPVCGGAFSFFEVRTQFEKGSKKTVHCPQCNVELLSYCGDILGHKRHEVDPSIANEVWLGEFAVWYYPVGCKACNCGILDRGYYPQQYSCCPGVVQLALQMARESDHSEAAVRFLSKHQDTLLNSLRGDFFRTYDLESLREFLYNHASPELASTIKSIIDDRAKSSDGP